MTVSSVKLFFFITFFQRFVSAQFCRLCLSDGSHLLQDALKESLKPQTEHISYFPITQADCHCVCETCWWRATDPTTQLTVIVFAKFSDEEPQIRPEKPGHFSSSPNCATVRYFWTSAFLVGSPNSHQVKYADFFKQLSTKSTTTIKAKAVTEQNLQFAAQGQIGHSLCRGQCSSGQPRIAGLGAHRCCSESRLSSVTIWFSRRAPQTSDSHQMKREARQSWSSSVAADIGHAEFWKTWQGALLPDLFSCSSDWTHTIRGQRLELPSFSDRAPSCCDQARCGAKSWKLQSWPNENSSEFIYLSIHPSSYLPTYLPKTKLFCKTSAIFKVDTINNEAILRDFLNFWSWQRRSSATLPSVLKLKTSKTKQFCKTSPIFEVDNIKNEAILRHFIQKWKVECKADGLIPIHFAIFPLLVSKLLRLPRKSEGKSYEVLPPVTQNHLDLASLKIWCGKICKMQPFSGNSRPDRRTCLTHVSLVLRLPREKHLCR